MEEREYLDEGSLGFLDPAEFNIVQSNVEKFKTLAREDNLQEWVKVSFMVQYCCCIIHYKLETSVLDIPQDPRREAMTRYERTRHYVRHRLPQADLFTQFMDALPITVKRGAKPWRHYKAVTFRLLELYALLEGQGFHDLFRNCLFFSENTADAHTNTNLCKHVLGPAVARFMTQVQTEEQAPGSTKLPGIPTVSQSMSAQDHNYNTWFKRVFAEGGTDLLLRTVSATFGTVNSDDVMRGHVAHGQRRSPAPAATDAIGTTTTDTRMQEVMEMQWNALAYDTPSSLTPHPSQGGTSEPPTTSPTGPAVLYTKEEVQQQIYAAWFNDPQQTITSPELARRVSALATRGVDRYPRINAYLEVAQWVDHDEERFSSAVLHTVMAADFCNNGRLNPHEEFRHDHFKSGYPQLFPLEYGASPPPTFPPEQNLRQLHDPMAASCWKNLGPLPKTMSRSFNGSEREMDTPTAIFNAQRTLANAGTYTNVSFFPDTDLARDCRAQAVLLPELPPYLREADASSLLLLRRRALLLLSTGASRQLTYRREDLLIQVNHGTLAVVAFNEATRTTLGGVQLQEHQTDWHFLPSSEVAPHSVVKGANLEALRAMDALVRETAGGRAPLPHKAYLAVMVRAGQQLMIPAGYWVAYTACTGVVGTLYSPIDGTTMARTTHTLSARPLPAPTHLSTITVQQRRAQCAALTAIRGSLWVAAALAFSHQACIRYMLRTLDKDDAYLQRTDMVANKLELDTMGTSIAVLLESYFQLEDNNVGTLDELRLVTDATGLPAPSEEKLMHHAPGLERREILQQVKNTITRHKGVMPQRLALSPIALQALQSIRDMGATTHAISAVAMRTLSTWVQKGKRTELTTLEREVLGAYQRSRPYDDDDSSSDPSSSSSSSNTSGNSTAEGGSDSSPCATDSDARMSTDDQGYSESNEAFVSGNMHCLLTDGSVPRPYRLQAYNEIDYSKLPTRNGARSRYTALSDGRFLLERSPREAVEAGSPPPNQLQKKYNEQGFFILQDVAKGGLENVAKAAYRASTSEDPRPQMPEDSVECQAARGPLKEMTRRVIWALNKYRNDSRGHFRVTTRQAPSTWERAYDFRLYNQRQRGEARETTRATYESMPILCLLALTPASLDVIKQGTVTLLRGSAIILRGDTAYRHTGVQAGARQAFYGVYLETTATRRVRAAPAANEQEQRGNWQQQCTLVHNDVQKLLSKRAPKTARLERHRPFANMIKTETIDILEEEFSDYLVNDTTPVALSDIPWVPPRMHEEDFSWFKYTGMKGGTPPVDPLPHLQDPGLSDGDEYEVREPPTPESDDFARVAADTARHESPQHPLRYSPELYAGLMEARQDALVRPQGGQPIVHASRTGTTLRSVALALAHLQPHNDTELPQRVEATAAPTDTTMLPIRYHWTGTTDDTRRAVTVAAVTLSDPPGTAHHGSAVPSPTEGPSRLLHPPPHSDAAGAAGSTAHTSVTTASATLTPVSLAALHGSAALDLEDGELAENETCVPIALAHGKGPARLSAWDKLAAACQGPPKEFSPPRNHRSNSRSSPSSSRRSNTVSGSRSTPSPRRITRSSRARSRSPPRYPSRNNGKSPRRSKRQKTRK